MSIIFKRSKKAIVVIAGLMIFMIVISFLIASEIINNTNDASVVEQTTNTTENLEASEFKQLSVNEKSENDSDNIALSIWTTRNEYNEQQFVTLLIRSQSAIDKDVIKLTIKIKDIHNRIVHHSTEFVIDDPAIPLFQYQWIPEGIGKYFVNLEATSLKTQQKEFATTSFQIISIFFTNTAIFLYIGGAFFIALLILISLSKQTNTTQEILRFVFLTGMVGSILGSLLFANVQFGIDSPVGLVQSGVGDDAQWIFNVGSVRLDQEDGSYRYVGGLQVPLYVILFGLIGGYIRYLYKTSRHLTDDEVWKERELIVKRLKDESNEGENLDKKEIEKRLIFFQSLKDVALFFLAPILSIVVWFLFSQWDPIQDSPYVLAVFSFATGLVTTDVINRITEFTKSNLQERTKPSTSSSP